jgi:phage terminase small subunit
MALTPKQARFVAEYLIDLNATDAAKRCGYSPKTAKQQGSRLLTDADVAQAVAEGKARQLQAADLTAARVLEEMRRLAFFDIAAIFDEGGNLRPIHDVPPEARAAITGVEVVRANLNPADGKRDPDYLHKVKVVQKDRALEMLAKHFGLLTEKVEHSGALLIQHEVPEG